MNKVYSNETVLATVTEYLSGALSQHCICTKHKISILVVLDK